VAGNDDATVRRLTYERTAEERDRIRDARAFFARQLGPLPAFAGISLAVVGAFSEKIKHDPFLWVALGLFAVMVMASVLYSRMPAYRELRAHRLRKGKLQDGRDADTAADWYRLESDLERSIYGSGDSRHRLWRAPWRNLDGDLQEQLDKERFGVFLVQILFLLVIASLLFAR
jgi:hypothetical protein